MAKEIMVASAREASANPANATNGRQTPRLYSTERDADYPSSVSLGISTRDASAQKDKDILDSVLGQLSDGIWENSPRMENYWRTMKFSQNDRGEVELRTKSSYVDYRDRWVRGRNERIPQYHWSPFSNMTNKGTKEWLAGKIKAIYDTERKYEGNVGKWSDSNDTKLKYMHGNVTVADAYSLYKRLKG